MAGVETKIRDIIQAQVEEDGFELLHVEMRSEGGAPILRVYIDSPDGITIDNCVDTSRKIPVLLDAETPVQGKYTLEV